MLYLPYLSLKLYHKSHICTFNMTLAQLKYQPAVSSVMKPFTRKHTLILKCHRPDSSHVVLSDSPLFPLTRFLFLCLWLKMCTHASLNCGSKFNSSAASRGAETHADVHFVGVESNHWSLMSVNQRGRDMTLLSAPSSFRGMPHPEEEAWIYKERDHVAHMVESIAWCCLPEILFYITDKYAEIILCVSLFWLRFPRAGLM